MLHVRAWLVITCVVVAGCRQHGEKKAANEQEPPVELQEGEIAIALGDCAPVTTPFVSGPEPQAFSKDQLAAPATSLYSTMADGGDVTASLDDGKHGVLGDRPQTGLDAPKPPPLVDPPATADLPAHRQPANPALFTPQINAAKLTQSYQPGTDSPLQTLRIALLDCFRRQDKRYAAAVFDLGPGTLVAHGIAGPAFDKCIADLAPQVKTTEPARCAVAFGTAPASSLPSAQITADAITIRGKKTTDVAAVLAGEPTPWWKIESAHAAAALRVRGTLMSREPLTLHGPLVVEPLPATPMKVVTKLVYTLIGAGDDPILAAQRDGQWQLLRERSLPLLPVPLGTGASWSSDLDRVHAAHVGDEPGRASLSVLVSNKDIWLAESKGSDAAWHTDKDLAAELTKLKASFADREDIEIAADDGVPYSRFVEVLDRVRAAGFTAWSLTAPVSLSAPPPPR